MLYQHPIGSTVPYQSMTTTMPLQPGTMVGAAGLLPQQVVTPVSVTRIAADGVTVVRSSGPVQGAMTSSLESVPTPDVGLQMPNISVPSLSSLPGDLLMSMSVGIVCVC